MLQYSMLNVVTINRKLIQRGVIERITIPSFFLGLRAQLLVSRVTGHVLLGQFHLSGLRVNQG